MAQRQPKLDRLLARLPSLAENPARLQRLRHRRILYIDGTRTRHGMDEVCTGRLKAGQTAYENTTDRPSFLRQKVARSATWTKQRFGIITEGEDRCARLDPPSLRSREPR